MNSVTNEIATLNLAQFNRPVGVNIIPNGQDWKNRQVLGYAAKKGLINKDFHGLADANEQLNLYSLTCARPLLIAWQAIRMLVPRNRNVLTTLALDTNLGLAVGKDLLKVSGFDQTFKVPTSILENPSALAKAVK